MSRSIARRRCGWPFSQVVNMLSRHGLVCVVEDILAVAETLSKAAPRWDRMISDNMFVKAQVKKHLIEWKGRDAHSASAVQLYRALTSLKSDHAALGAQHSLEELAHDQLRVASAVYKGAKQLLTIVAYCNVLLGLTGEQQHLAAVELMAKQYTAPTVLQDELEKLTHAPSAPPPTARSAGKRKSA